jgi:hypothetical protein
MKAWKCRVEAGHRHCAVFGCRGLHRPTFPLPSQDSLYLALSLESEFHIVTGFFAFRIIKFGMNMFSYNTASVCPPFVPFMTLT